MEEAHNVHQRYKVLTPANVALLTGLALQLENKREKNLNPLWEMMETSAEPGKVLEHPPLLPPNEISRA